MLPKTNAHGNMVRRECFSCVEKQHKTRAFRNWTPFCIVHVRFDVKLTKLPFSTARFVGMKRPWNEVSRCGYLNITSRTQLATLDDCLCHSIRNQGHFSNNYAASRHSRNDRTRLYGLNACHRQPVLAYEFIRLPGSPSAALLSLPTVSEPGCCAIFRSC